MKTVGKMVFTLVAMLTMVATASAATDKLIVNNGSGTPVFKVDDAGTVSVGSGIVQGSGMVFNNTTKKYGFGTANPLTSLQITEDEPTSASVSRGLTLAQHGSNVAASVIAINRSRGTEAAPANLIQGDNIAAFHAKPYDALNLAGNWYMPTATFAFVVDGATSNGTAPTAIQFFTGSNAATRLERLRVSSNGGLRVSNQPSAPANNATCTTGDLIFDAPNGYLYMCVAANTWKRATFATY